MLSGSLILASLLLAANGAPDVWYMGSPKFSIPIRILPQKRGDIAKLLLYVSKDEGRNWTVATDAKPDQEAFPFFAQGDGPYWFKVAVVGKNGQQDPSAQDIYTAPVGQRIVVDTTRPDVKLVMTERRGDEIYVKWEIREENPDPTTLKLEYRTTDMANDQWTPVAATPDSHGRGEVTFRPRSGAAVTVRMKLQDLAQNVGETTAEILASTFVAPPGPITGTGASSWMPTPPPAGLTQMEPVPVRLPEPAPPTPTPTPVTPIFTTTNAVNTGTAAVPVPPVQPPPPVTVPSGNPVASTTAFNSGTLPTKQIINKKQVRLDFEVARYGPSGIGAVDVYLTTDDGRNWEKARPDKSLNLPIPAPVQGGPMRGVVTVELAREAVTYGLYLVVKSGANLGKPAPHSGDLPQMRVEVDTTSPVAQLIKPQADLNRRDTLILTWTASDRNLAPNPITLEWAARSEGPWNLIGSEQMPNTGLYSWQVSGNVPPSVYLRMTVRDLAGNASVAQTSEPELVDLSEPVAQITGLAGAAQER
jgi:hypothetical protein